MTALPQLLVVAGVLLQAVAVACFVPVLVHAFKRSVGTGFMVLCLPYTLYYAFSQFEHRARGPLLATWLGGFVVGAVLRVLGLKLGLGA